MKVSELAGRSGVSISTIKYYIREGLLRSGDTSAPNQALYGEDHLSDLVLIRALREHAGLSISAIRRVLSAVATAGSERESTLDAGFRSVGRERSAERDRPVADRDDPEYARALAALKQVMAERDWQRAEDDPDVQDALAAMMAVGHIWPHELPSGGWKRYAELGEQAASFEIPEGWDPDRFPRETVRYAIVGTYLFEPVVLAFRRLALSERSMRVQRERRNAQNDPEADAAPLQPPWMMPLRD